MRKKGQTEGRGRRALSPPSRNFYTMASSGQKRAGAARVCTTRRGCHGTTSNGIFNLGTWASQRLRGGRKQERPSVHGLQVRASLWSLQEQTWSSLRLRSCSQHSLTPPPLPLTQSRKHRPSERLGDLLPSLPAPS